MSQVISQKEILQMQAGIDMDALVAVKIMGLDVKHDWHWKQTTRNYSDDISAAMEVVEQMHRNNYQYTLRGHFMGVEQHIATFDDQDWADANPLYKAHGATAALAICRAALLAVMSR